MQLGKRGRQRLEHGDQAVVADLVAAEAQLGEAELGEDGAELGDALVADLGVRDAQMSHGVVGGQRLGDGGQALRVHLVAVQEELGQTLGVQEGDDARVGPVAGRLRLLDVVDVCDLDRDQREPRVALLLAGRTDEELAVGLHGELERPQLLAVALLLHRLLAHHLAADREVHAALELLVCVALKVGQTVAGQLEPALLPLLAALDQEPALLVHLVADHHLRVLQLDDAQQGLVLLLQLLVQIGHLLVEALVCDVTHHLLQVELVGALLQVVQLTPLVHVLQVLLEVALQRVQSGAGTALHDHLLLQAAVLLAQRGQLLCLADATRRLVGDHATKVLQLLLQHLATLLQHAQAGLALSRRHRQRVETGLELALLVQQLVALALQALAVLLCQGLGELLLLEQLAQGGDLALEQVDAVVVELGALTQVLELGLQVGEAVQQAVVLVLQVGLRGLQLDHLLLALRQLLLDLLLGLGHGAGLHLGLLCGGESVEVQRRVEDHGTLVHGAVDQIVGVEQLRDAQVLLGVLEGGLEVLGSVRRVQRTIVHQISVEAMNERIEGHAIVEAGLEIGHVHVVVAVGHLADPLEQTIFGALVLAVIAGTAEAFLKTRAEKTPQHTQNQLHVSLVEIFRANTKKTNFEVLLNKLERKREVLNLLHLDSGLAVDTSDAAASQTFKEDHQLDTTAKISLELFDLHRLLAQITVHPSGETLLLNLDPSLLAQGGVDLATLVFLFRVRHVSKTLRVKQREQRGEGAAVFRFFRLFLLSLR
mmetsp:Transcript_10250/g.25751  ORF Transcript_10250/g.25751 Transcript_10250/m.25751 type:complete len:766 (+) Transcript_10250:805-3102(+)